MDRQTLASSRAAAVAILAAVCVLGRWFPSPSAQAVEPTLNLARSEEVDEATARFQSSLRSALETGEAARQKWSLVVWESLRCYEPAQVSRTLEQMKSDIYLAASADPRLAALRAYLNGRLERIGRMPPMVIVTLPGAVPGQVKRVFGVRTDQADASWRELRDFAQSFLGEARLAVDLTVRTEPPGAQIELHAVSWAAKKITVASDVQLHNLWRGAYRVSVAKPGYKPAALDLDLMGQRFTALTCTLARSKSAEASRCEYASSR